MEGEEGVNNSSQMCARRGARGRSLGGRGTRAGEAPLGRLGPLSLITSSSLSCPWLPQHRGGLTRGSSSPPALSAPAPASPAWGHATRPHPRPFALAAASASHTLPLDSPLAPPLPCVRALSQGHHLSVAFPPHPLRNCTLLATHPHAPSPPPRNVSSTRAGIFVRLPLCCTPRA